MSFGFKLLLLMAGLGLSVPAFAPPPRPSPGTASSCTSAFRLIVDNAAPNWEMFRTLYANAEPTPLGKSLEVDNQRYIDLLAAPAAADLVFVHGSMKPMKRLNDHLFAEESGAGKKDVDASRNLFRILFIENLEENAELKKALVSRFIDFKSMEFAFDRTKLAKPELFDAQINELLVTTQLQYETAMQRYLTQNPDLVRRLVEERGLTSDLRAWHHFGVATGHPDLAVCAARAATSEYDTELGMRSLGARKFDEAVIQKKLFRADRTEKKALLESLGKDSPVFMLYENSGERVLSFEALDVLRKVEAANLEEYIDKVQKDFKLRVNVTLTEAQVLQLRDYFALAGDFMPSVRGAKRGRIAFEQARFGAANVDFARQNVVNYYHTMGAMALANARAVAGHESPARLAIQLSRAGDVLATNRLVELRETFDKARNAAEITGDYQHTGDDGAVILSGLPTETQQIALGRELLKLTTSPADYRIVWVPTIQGPSGIDAAAMSKESIKGENFEKKLRQALYGQLRAQGDTDPGKTMDSVAFTTVMDPAGRTFQLYIVGGNRVIDTAVATIVAPGLIEGYRLQKTVVVR